MERLKSIGRVEWLNEKDSKFEDNQLFDLSVLLVFNIGEVI